MSATYAAEPSAGGGAARNSLSEASANGVTSPHCGLSASAKAGPVGRHTPGWLLPACVMKAR